ncbi:heme-dependent oxidative N-demethylase family protein [Gordonia sp. VNK21]|uniref:heme-dependent oxidative N-demethylase family protein n=1 Tax=Gordonia sp. VNK21 TaxID=3382483 RepID=UPI0038D3AD28
MTGTSAPAHCAHLPWPFPDDLTVFDYSVNVEPARTPRRTRAGEWGAHLVDLGGDRYPEIMAERRRILDADPGRVRIGAGMDQACWELLLYYLRDLALSYPESMTFTEDACGRCRWRNEILGTAQDFVVGDGASLPYGPMEFLAREIPDDLLLVTERDSRLYFDAGVVTFAAGWSVAFDVGMDMYEIHAPVPRMLRAGIVARAEQFLRSLPADQVYRRVNWTLSASDSDKLDVSLEQRPEWAGDIPSMLADGDFGRARLRIELEHFIRLPASGAVTFNIRTFTAGLDEIRTVPEWAAQLATVIETLADDIASYKGFLDYRDDVVAYLRGA